VKLAVTHRTNLAEVLSDDEVGSQPSKLVAIDGDHRLAGFTQATDLGIYLVAWSSDVYRRRRHPRKTEYLRGEVALVRDPHQRVQLSESGDDLGSRRECADDSHHGSASRLGR